MAMASRYVQDARAVSRYGGLKLDDGKISRVQCQEWVGVSSSSAGSQAEDARPGSRRGDFQDLQLRG